MHQIGSCLWSVGGCWKLAAMFITFLRYALCPYRLLQCPWQAFNNTVSISLDWEDDVCFFSVHSFQDTARHTGNSLACISPVVYCIVLP